jgi:uncharacterized repeat protein (TIGR03803 family)
MNPELTPSTANHISTRPHSARRIQPQWSRCPLALAITLVLAAVLAPSAQAQTLTVLYSFQGVNDAWSSVAPVLYVNGNVYGTTQYGNSTTICQIGHFPSNGCGTVFEISPAGTETLLHVFSGSPDGMRPEGGLIQDSAGNFYGTTIQGGASGNATFFGYGSVYKVDVSGNESVLYNFTGMPDGGSPKGNLIIDAKGNLYGTTAGGGTFGFGTVFKLDPNGNETILYSFAGPPGDGAGPAAGLIHDAKGNLYGTTQYGGNAGGYGTVFKLDSSGHETVLYSFAGKGDGNQPQSSLALDAMGNLYGTAYYGGPIGQGHCAAGCGTVFRVDTTGKFRVVYSFKGGADGQYPVGGLLRSLDGKSFYGTTTGISDTVDAGTVFRLSASGETVLFGFPTSSVDGSAPFATLTQDAAGNLYGATFGSGSNNFGFGNVFRLTP